jgi:hypothetical protein
MLLHMTKLAYGASSYVDLVARIESRVREEGRMFMTTRYLPKRHEEIAGEGSLYWIVRHQLIARAGITGFEQNAEGRWNILLEPRAIPVRPAPRRAHQGWRYLEASDAPPDLLETLADGEALPPSLCEELALHALI